MRIELNKEQLQKLRKQSFGIPYVSPMDMAPMEYMVHRASNEAARRLSNKERNKVMLH